MARLTASILLASGLVLAAAPVHAMVKITNETDATHSVTFDHGAEENQFDVEPGATVEEACPTGCGVRFSGHDFLANDGDELFIQDGATRPVMKN